MLDFARLAEIKLKNLRYTKSYKGLIWPNFLFPFFDILLFTDENLNCIHANEDGQNEESPHTKDTSYRIDSTIFDIYFAGISSTQLVVYTFFQQIFCQQSLSRQKFNQSGQDNGR